jgi:Rps23 Pro-64 3,4-dihydroxylase Tpa1-like proline 4-hydroxylase
MFTFEKLGDGLVYYKDLIKNPKNIIEDIESLNKKVEEGLSLGTPGMSASMAKPWHNWDYKQDGMNLHFCKQRWLPRTRDMIESDILFKEHSDISDRLFLALDTAFNHYSKELYPYAARSIKGGEDNMSILKYEKAGFLSEHIDHGTSSRTLSVVLYLNDEYSGGEINFPHVGNGITIKPEAGSAIFFPSNFVFTHSVNEISDGIRYSLPNWYHNMTNKIQSDGRE